MAHRLRIIPRERSRSSFPSPPAGRPISRAGSSLTSSPVISARNSWWRMSAVPGARSARFAPPAPPADGYTILSGHLGTNALAPAFYPNLAYDPQKDFEPIGLTAEYPELLVVRKGFSRQQPQGIRCLRQIQSGQAQCRACRARLGILYRLPASSRGDWHQADDDSVYRHSPGVERHAGGSSRL